MKSNLSYRGSLWDNYLGDTTSSIKKVLKMRISYQIFKILLFLLLITALYKNYSSPSLLDNMTSFNFYCADKLHASLLNATLKTALTNRN